jgi:hypothetical protein
VYEDLCTYALFASYSLAIGGIIAMWLVPPEYDFGQVLSIALMFFDAQKSGVISAEVRIGTTIHSHPYAMQAPWILCQSLTYLLSDECHWLLPPAYPNLHIKC